MRYLYANSTRSSHAVERVEMLGNAHVVALCGRNPEWFGWQISFDKQKPLCKHCAAVIEWREQIMQRRYRTLQPLTSYRHDKPWSLPRGAVSVAITREGRCFFVHFLAVGKVKLPLEDMDKHADWFACTYDPTITTTQPSEPLPLDGLPLFQEVS